MCISVPCIKCRIEKINTTQHQMTTSAFDLAEKIALPFTGALAFGISALGYYVWHFQRNHGENMTGRMAMWFKATSAALVGQALLHALPNSTETDFTLFVLAFLLGFVPLVCMEMFWSSLQCNDDDILLNRWNERTNYVVMDTDEVPRSGPDIQEAARINKRRRVIAVMTYLVVLFQSSVDGLFLKYNLNAEEPATQVAMFFLSKILEAVIISSAIILAAPKVRQYWLFSINFAVAVSLSTLAVYDFVDPIYIIQTVEHWAFKGVLGISAGVLMWLAMRFHVLDSGNPESTRRKVVLCITYVVIIVISYATGRFG